MPEKLHPSGARKGKTRKSRQVTTDTGGNSAASNCRYGPKIPASNYLIRPENSAASNPDTAGKSRQVTTRYGRKIRLPVATETAGKYKAAVAQW